VSIFYFFFQLSGIFQPVESLPASFPYTNPIGFVERQFSFHRIVWRNAKQEGRGQNNCFLGNKEKKKKLKPGLSATSVLS